MSNEPVIFLQMLQQMAIGLPDPTDQKLGTMRYFPFFGTSSGDPPILIEDHTPLIRVTAVVERISFYGMHAKVWTYKGIVLKVGRYTSIGGPHDHREV